MKGHSISQRMQARWAIPVAVLSMTGIALPASGDADGEGEHTWTIGIECILIDLGLQQPPIFSQPPWSIVWENATTLVGSTCPSMAELEFTTAGGLSFTETAHGHQSASWHFEGDQECHYHDQGILGDGYWHNHGGNYFTNYGPGKSVGKAPTSAAVASIGTGSEKLSFHYEEKKFESFFVGSEACALHVGSQNIAGQGYAAFDAASFGSSLGASEVTLNFADIVVCNSASDNGYWTGSHTGASFAYTGDVGCSTSVGPLTILWGSLTGKGSFGIVKVT